MVKSGCINCLARFMKISLFVLKTFLSVVIMAVIINA